MSSLGYVMLASALVWAGVAVYVAFLGLRSAELSRRLTQLEALCRRPEAGHDR